MAPRGTEAIVFQACYTSMGHNLTVKGIKQGSVHSGNISSEKILQVV